MENEQLRHDFIEEIDEEQLEKAIEEIEEDEDQNLLEEMHDEEEEMSSQLKDVNQYAERVLKYYPIKVNGIKLKSSKSGRTKWIVDTDQGKMVLKQAIMPPGRMLFISNAHEHLQKNGVPMAKIIKTKGGGLCVAAGDHAFILYEHHEGKEVLYYSRNHLKKIMEFMADFHIKSKGFHSIDGTKKRRRVGKWEKLYRWKLQELEGFKKLAQNYQTDPFSELFLQHVDQMLELGRQSLEELNHAEFDSWTKAVIESKMFCQQDFTLARLILKDDQIFMSELHSVNHDLPSRDLRLFLTKVMKKQHVWDSQLCCEMLRAYDRKNPLTKGNYKVLWTDLKFPHLFCAIIHKYYLSQKKAWSDEKYLAALKNTIAVETTKMDFIHQFDDMVERIKLEGAKDNE